MPNPADLKVDVKPGSAAAMTGNTEICSAGATVYHALNQGVSGEAQDSLFIH